MKNRNLIQEDMELLLSGGHRGKQSRGVRKLDGRVKWYLFLTVSGVVGTLLCLTALFIFRSELSAQGANRTVSLMERVVDLLGLPVLMFCVIACVYGAQRLFALYRLSNNPVTHRR